MNNLPLQPLKWFETEYSVGLAPNIGAQGAGIFYRIAKVGDNKAAVTWHDQSEGSTGAKELGSVCDAKHWIETDHYPSKMQPYVKPDSITDIANWFKAAKPEPTIEDLCVQIGCHLEEVCELLEALGLKDYDTHEQLTIDADHFKNKSKWVLTKLTKLTYQQRIDIVDACCDTNVTGTGIMQLLGGVDVLGAQREVVRSNNSKMVDGKFEFDDNGKIQKPDSYSEPDLIPFISTMQNLHKGGDCE